MLHWELKEAIEKLRAETKLSSHRLDQILRILRWADASWDNLDGLPEKTTFDEVLHNWSARNPQ